MFWGEVGMTNNIGDYAKTRILGETSQNGHAQKRHLRHTYIS
jgi:hypothetical protein